MIILGAIGCGGISQRAHMPSIEHLRDRVAVDAIADVSGENLAAVGAQMDVRPERRFADYRDMLGSGGLDAVLIATKLPSASKARGTAFDSIWTFANRLAT